MTLKPSIFFFNSSILSKSTFSRASLMRVNSSITVNRAFWIISLAGWRYDFFHVALSLLQLAIALAAAAFARSRLLISSDSSIFFTKICKNYARTAEMRSKFCTLREKIFKFVFFMLIHTLK